MNPSPVLLLIFDGFGVNPSRLNNGWLQAETPNLDQYFAHNPHTLLQASGRAVGLPDGQFGNSEVGHLTIGSGRILEQDLLRIAESIEDGGLQEHPIWDSLTANAERLHLIGLVSDGGVHSHIEHLLEILPPVVQAGITPVIHMITDGRDTAPRCAQEYVDKVEKKLEALGKGYIATVCGRYWAMDRAKHYERTEKAWRTMVLGEGLPADSATTAIAASYENDQGDEFIDPYVIGNPEDAVIRPEDPVLFFNFRNDRARQLAAAIGLTEFNEFDRGDVGPRRLVCVTQYAKNYPFPVLFPPEHPNDVLCSVISRAGLKQFHCAETEKFPHVTYFFNGGIEEPFEGEEHVMIPSPEIATYDLQPEMSTAQVADRLIEAIESKQYSFVLANFANGDMVGHSAEMNAVVKAVETLDYEGHRVAEVALQHGFRVIITADHGNCDEVIDPGSGQPHTQHSVYPVPFLLLGEKSAKLGIGRGLADIAPTVLELMGLSKPIKMTGRSLLLKKSLMF